MRLRHLAPAPLLLLLCLACGATSDYSSEGGCDAPTVAPPLILPHVNPSQTAVVRLFQAAGTTPTGVVDLDVNRTLGSVCETPYQGATTPEAHGLPAGLSASFTPASLPPITAPGPAGPESVKVTFTVQAGLKDGDYPITIVTHEFQPILPQAQIIVRVQTVP